MFKNPDSIEMVAQDEELEKIVDDVAKEFINDSEELKKELDKFNQDCTIHLKTEDIIELFRDVKKILSSINGIEKQYITADVMAAIFNYGVNQNKAIKTISELSNNIEDQSKKINKFWKYLLIATIGSGIFSYTMAVYQHENIKPILYNVSEFVVNMVTKSE